MNAVDEIARELEKQLQEATSKVESFVAQQTALLSKAQQDHEQLMRDMEAKIMRLKAEEAEASSRLSAVSGSVSSERAQLTEKREEIARLEAEVAAMPSELEAAKAKQEAAELMLARQRAEYERQEASVREQLAELTKGPEFYASRLGLAFEEMRDSNLRCVFTLIDPAAPDRRFCFNLRVNDDDSYGVSGCDPDVPDLPQLVTQLNAANDLGSFFRDMRKRFQAIAGVRSSSGGGSSRGGAGGR